MDLACLVHSKATGRLFNATSGLIQVSISSAIMLYKSLSILLPVVPLALAATSSTIDLSWHTPSSNQVNDLSSTINGTGVYGFIFNSSQTPAGLPSNQYNWCNMPHVTPSSYPRVNDSSLKLEYVELIHRHHKRTPYAANTFPRETYGWNCSDAALYYYGAPAPYVHGNRSAAGYWEVAAGPLNPFMPSGFNPSSCQFPQITKEGLDDSWAHGRDLWTVYHDMLRLVPDHPTEQQVHYRVTNNVITSQVAGMVINGQQGTTTAHPLHVQPSGVDSLEPQYTCSAASSLYSSYGVGSSSSGWTAHLTASHGLVSQLDQISGVSPTDNSWHQSWDHYFDNLSARLCHAKPLPCNTTFTPQRCVTQDMANEVFRLGEYEYSYIYRDNPSSLPASTASYGVWVAELAQHLRDARDRKDAMVYRHNVAHDGSLSRLLSILQIDKMVWPGMGSEVVFELYSKRQQYYVRILWSGQVLQSSTPVIGRADLVPLDRLLAYFDGLVGARASLIPGKCSGS